MRGRPPKPIEQHRREGTLRPERHAATPLLVGGRGELERPAWLSGLAAAAWDALYAHLSAAGVLDVADAGVLEGAAVAWARAREAGALVNRDGMTREVTRFGRDRTEFTTVEQHPAVRIERDSWALFLRLGEQLGLTPAARARLGNAGAQGRDFLDEFPEFAEIHVLPGGGEAS